VLFALAVSSGRGWAEAGDGWTHWYCVDPCYGGGGEFVRWDKARALHTLLDTPAVPSLKDRMGPTLFVYLGSRKRRRMLGDLLRQWNGMRSFHDQARELSEAPRMDIVVLDAGNQCVALRHDGLRFLRRAYPREEALQAISQIRTETT
jgi:hypothetical protein